MVKRILPCLMALLMLFTSVLRPVYAAEVVEDMEIPFSINYAGDTIVFTDDYGHILEVRPNDAATYNTLALPLSLTGTGGAMGLGTVALSPEVLVIIAAVLATGVVVWSVHGIVEECTKLYHLLSDSAQAELTEIYEEVTTNTESDGSFTFSESTASSFGHAFKKVFYDGDALRDAGLTFSAISLLDYSLSLPEFTDHDDPALVGANLCVYPLTAESVAIKDTSLTVSLVDNVFGFDDESLNPTLNLVNTKTGASLTFSLSADAGSFMGYDCSEYRISAPFVRTFTDSSDRVYHKFGFFLLRHCLEDDCFYSYSLATGFYETNYGIYANNSYWLFSNTGIEGLDNKIFNRQDYNATTGKFDLTTESDEVVSLPQSALQTIMSDVSYDITVAPGVDAPSLPDDETKVYIPPSDVLSNADRLTHTGATTGVWDDSLTDTGDTTVPDVDADATFWEKLVAWLRSIVEAINGVASPITTAISNVITAIQDITFTDIVDSITDIPGSIATAVEGVLEKIFVPDLTALESLLGVYTAKFGWVSDIFGYVKQMLNNLAPSSPPKIPIHLGAAESKYNWGGDTYILDMSWYSRYKSSGDTIISGICWIWFAWAMFRRLPDILSGVGMIEENRTLPQGYRKERSSNRGRGSD